MTIERLMAVVPPPAAPSEVFRGSWEPVEAEIGRALPPDYKELVRLYGGGSFFRDTVLVYVPGATTPGARLESQVPLICSTIAELGFDGLPCRVWPQADGVIPIGGTNCGDYIFWLPEGEAAAWKVAVWIRGLGGLEVFDCDLTDFLAGLASSEILPDAFPELVLTDRLFEPFPPVADWRRRIAFTGAAESSLRLSWRMGSAGPSGVSPTQARRPRD